MSGTAAPLANDGLFCFLDEAHQAVQRQLEVLHALTAAAEAGDLAPAQRAQARELLDWFSTEARQHHLDEEKHVFPALLTSKDPEIIQTTHRLIQDHGWLEADWLEIEPALSAAAEGNHWFDPALLRNAVDVFAQLYRDHIVLEESLAYPEAHDRIDPLHLQAINLEMTQRRALRATHG